jgi:hypothetical protein
MNWSRWQSPSWKAHSRRPAAPDLADMGTAFALDASFDHVESDPPSALVPSGARAGTTVESPKQRWWPRWRAGR